MLIFGAAVATLAGLAFGLVPALQAARENLNDKLKAGFRESAVGARLRMRNLLVILETSLGVIVVIGAGLLLRSFRRIEQVPLGFQPQGVLTFRVIPRGARYAEVSQRAAFYQQALLQLKGLPEVKSAGAVRFLPLTLIRASKGFTIEGRAQNAPGQIPMTGYSVVTPGYFSTMQIPLLEGRDFSWTDTVNGQPVTIINSAMAKLYWPGDDPLGKRIRQSGPDDHELSWLTIAGVVGDVREFDPVNQPRPTMYFPLTQFADADGILRDWVIRTAGDPIRVASGIRGAIWSVDKDLPITRVRTMEEVRSMSVGSRRLSLILFSLFAAIAMILATVGIYGVMTYRVTQRTREIGIRVALGAPSNQVMRLVVGQAARLATVGVFLGVIGALALTRLMAGMVYSVSSTDPATFVTVALLLTLMALAACYLPARRAMKVDPMVALRYE